VAATVDEAGLLVSVVDLASGRDAIPAGEPGNLLQLHRDVPRPCGQGSARPPTGDESQPRRWGTGGMASMPGMSAGSTFQSLGKAAGSVAVGPSVER
jgi:hypothetical protein